MAATSIADFNVTQAISDLQYINPNYARIQREVVAIMEALLPVQIAETNTLFGTRIAPPKKYEIAPALLDTDFIDTCLVSIRCDRVEPISPRNFVNFSLITVYMIGAPIRSSIQVPEMWDKAAAAQGVLYQYLNGYSSPDGKRIWSQLTPPDTPIEGLPEEWADYSGVSVTFQGRHDPGHSLWKLP